MSGPRHLPFERLKTVAGRLMYFESVPDVLQHAGLTDAQVAELLRLLQGEMFNVTNEFSIRHPGGGSGDLDRFLKRAVAGLMDYVDRRALSGPESEVLKPWLGGLQKRADEFDCRKCSPSKICCGSLYQDNKIIANGGRCIDSIKQLFRLATNASELYYQTYATNCPKKLPRVELSTAIDSPAHELSVPYHVNGVTEYNSDGNCTVKLILDTEKFDRETFGAVPYILFHECVSHAFQGMNAKGRKHCDPDDGFAEGWMDWTACGVLERLVRGVDPGLKLPARERLSREHEQTAVVFRDARSNASAAASINAGVKTAQHFFAFLEDLTESYEEAWAVFFRISFDLNLYHQSSDRATTFFKVLFNQLPNGLLARTFRRNRLKTIIMNYLDSGNIPALVSGVLRLEYGQNFS